MTLHASPHSKDTAALHAKYWHSLPSLSLSFSLSLLFPFSLLNSMASTITLGEFLHIRADVHC